MNKITKQRNLGIKYKENGCQTAFHDKPMTTIKFEGRTLDGQGSDMKNTYFC